MDDNFLANDVLLENRYRVLSLIGQGGISKTYLAKDEEKAEDVVLKTLAYNDIKDFKQLELFEREIEILKNIDYPFIPNYYANFKTTYENEKLFVLVQEYVDGKNLYELIQDGRHFTASEIRDIFRKLLETLVYIHRLNPPIVHRDITPKNVILTKHNEVYLVDFGAVGRIVDSTIAAARSNTFVGTIGYMPPEQLFGKATPASDLYSLGATIIFLLTGKQPADFELDNMKIDFKKETDIPKSFEELLDELIEPDYKKRISNAKTVLNRLSNVIIVGTKKKKPSQNNETVLQKDEKKKESKTHTPEKLKFSTITEKLYKAVDARDVSYAKRLIKKGADCKAVNEKTGLTPLHLVAKNGYARLTEILLEHTGDVDIRSKDGKTPFVLAMENNHMDVAVFLLGSGADINVVYQGKTLLHQMTYQGYISLVRSLIKHGIDINAVDSENKTALEYAYENGNQEIEDLLIEKGAAVNAKTYGKALLLKAITGRDVEYVAKLVDEGAMLNEKLRNNEYPVETAMLHNIPKEIAEILVKGGAKLDVNAKNGDTLFNMVVKKAKHFVPFLIENGVNVNGKTKKGDTPLITAIKADKVDVVKDIVDAGCDLELPGQNGITPLKAAYDKDSTRIIKVLAEAGADLNARINHKALLHYAVIEEKSDIARLLLEAEAYVDIKETQGGKTPLQLAYELDLHEMKDLLHKFGASSDFDFAVTNKFKNLSPPPRKLSFIDKYRLLTNRVASDVGYIFLFVISLSFLFLLGYRWLGVISAWNLSENAVAHPVKLERTNFNGGSRAKYIVYYVFNAHDENVYSGYSYISYKQYKEFFTRYRNWKLKNNMVVQYSKSNPAISRLKDSWFTNFGNYFPLIVLLFLGLMIFALMKSMFNFKNFEILKILKKGKVADGKITDKTSLGSISYYNYEFFDDKKRKNMGIFEGDKKYAKNGDIVPVLYLPGKSYKNVCLKSFDCAKAKLNYKDLDLVFKPGLNKSYIFSAIFFAVMLFFAFLYLNNLFSKVFTGYSAINVRDRRDRTLLINAVRRRQNNLVGILIKNKKIDLNSRDRYGYSALYYSTYYYNPFMVKELVKNGADINIKDKKGRTPLIVAIQRRNFNAVKLLTGLGANINLGDNRNITPLMWAFYKRKAYLYNYLLEKGARINQKNQFGQSVLMYAFSTNKPEVIQRLIDKGADIHARNNKGETCLIKLLRTRVHYYNHRKVIHILIKSGANVNAKDKKGMTALMYAARRSSGTVRVILQYPVNLDVQDNEGKTALMHAAIKERYYYCLRALLEKGAKVNIKDNEGKTALMYAAGKVKSTSVRLLLEKGADKTIKDKSGQTALNYAKLRNYNQRVIKLLTGE